MKKYLWLIFFILTSVLYATSPLVLGLDSYARGNWRVAIEQFQNAINNAKREDEIETALYYLVMSLASSNKYKSAINSSNIFLSRYPNSDKYPDVMYQRGRLYCLLGLYEKALKELYSFINQYPTNKSLPAAYYWIAESLYLGGRLQEARDVFSRILLNYPLSQKAELAKQRISLIDQAATQKELLALLKLNQEQTMNLADEYAKKQKEFEKTIVDYKSAPTEKVDDMKLLDIERVLEEERAKNAELYEKLLVLEAKNKELIDALAMLDKLDEDEPSKEEKEEDEDAEVATDEEENSEKEKENNEAAEKRRLLLEMLKRKARQLEGMYDEILEEEKNESE